MARPPLARFHYERPTGSDADGRRAHGQRRRGRERERVVATNLVVHLTEQPDDESVPHKHGLQLFAPGDGAMAQASRLARPDYGRRHATKPVRERRDFPCHNSGIQGRCRNIEPRGTLQRLVTNAAIVSCESSIAKFFRAAERREALQRRCRHRVNKRKLAVYFRFR